MDLGEVYCGRQATHCAALMLATLEDIGDVSQPIISADGGNSTLELRKACSLFVPYTYRVSALVQANTGARFRGKFTRRWDNALKELEEIFKSIARCETLSDIEQRRQNAISILRKVHDEGQAIEGAWDEQRELQNIEEDCPTCVMRILLISDLHYGMEGGEWLWPSFKDKFLQDLEKAHAQCGILDLVLFCGDLTFSAKQTEYKHVDNILGEIFQVLAQKGSKRAVLLGLPGNHDLSRPADRGRATLIEQVCHSQHWREEFFSRRANSDRDLVREAFHGFEEWQTRSLDHQEKAESKLCRSNISVGFLPGDLAFTLEKDNRSLGILCLNTAFLQLQDGRYRGRLQVHPRQFNEACDGDGPRWAGGHHACILCTHHPSFWLDSASRELFDTDIYLPDRFFLNVYGHMHTGSFKESSRELGLYKRELQLRSLFGMKWYLDDEAERRRDRLHGYAILEVTLSNTFGEFRLWPRMLHPERQVIVTDSDFRTRNGWTEPQRFRLARSTGP